MMEREADGVDEDEACVLSDALGGNPSSVRPSF